MHLIVPYRMRIPFYGEDCKINYKNEKNYHIINKNAGFFEHPALFLFAAKSVSASRQSSFIMMNGLLFERIVKWKGKKVFNKLLTDS